ncbi:unnamed protein product [Prorocentrum cordatum]|uniref:Uncharacterized protein n=1 Tax=Prorocentrum cordatum TaxID=2364126 RepID=A0ABN9RN40_9DINO|nr:unnamed protein product [Polarella glacialis]
MMGAKWWTQVGRHVYTAPTEDNGLSDRVEDYYCAMGSDDALTDSMREKRVGGEGRWHIFHLPEGPSSLGITNKGGRRSAFSSLVQLRSGAVLNIMFPAYTPQQSCASASGRLGGMEAAAVARLTAGSFMSTLQEVVALGNSDGVVTRSYQDSSGQDAAQKIYRSSSRPRGFPPVCRSSAPTPCGPTPSSRRTTCSALFLEPRARREPSLSGRTTTPVRSRAPRQGPRTTAAD